MPDLWHKLVRYFLTAICLLLVPVSGLAALQMVQQEREHAASPVQLMQTGFALSAQAARSLTQASTTQADGSVSIAEGGDDAIAAMSRAAIQREPLDARAFANLGLLALARDDQKRSFALLHAAQDISRRNVQANLLIAHLHGQRGDFASLTQAMGRALRVSYAARETVIPSLLIALEDEANVPAMAALLRDGAQWEDDFWTAAMRAERGVRNFAQLRAVRAHAGYVAIASRDEAIFRKLILQDEFAAAQELSKALNKGRGEGDGNLLNNGDFTAQQGIGPFQWQLHPSAMQSATIDHSAGTLQMINFGGDGGLAARQLVDLSGAAYELDIDRAELGGGELSVSLSCAHRGETAARRNFALLRGESRIAIHKTSPSCRYHWLELHLPASPNGREETILLDRIALRSAHDGEE